MIANMSGRLLGLEELYAAATDATRLRAVLMDLAARLPNVISLGQGDPDLNTPPHVIAAAQEAIREGRADIPAPPQGLPELREAIAAKLRRDNQIPVEADGVLVTNGSQEALYLVMHALVDDGDEILVPDPRDADRLLREIERWRRYAAVSLAVNVIGVMLVFATTAVR